MLCVTQQIGQNLEVYVEDMIVKTIKMPNHAEDLEDILQSSRKYDMRLNLASCSFGVQAEKFLGFILTRRSIEANLDKFLPFLCHPKEEREI